jgi:gluconolactonase
MEYFAGSVLLNYRRVCLECQAGIIALRRAVCPLLFHPLSSILRRFLFFAEVAMRILSVFCCLLSVGIAAAELPKPSGETIVSPDAKLELLFTRSAAIHGGLTEGPALAPDGSIYFSDIPIGKDKGMILRFDPKTKKTSVFTGDSHKANGLKFDAKGYLIACEGSDEGGRCVSRWDVKTRKRTVIADRYQGKRFNAPNDLTLDRRGRIYFTDPRYLGSEPRELEHRAVYRLDPNGQIAEVTHALEKPNGIALSPDGGTLYVADHNNGTDRIDPAAAAPKAGAMKIYAFRLDADGKVKGSGKVLIDFGAEPGCDGMTVDAKGNLYLAVRSLKRPGILVLDPKGKEVGFLPTGAAQPDAKEPKGIPSNCCFGGGGEKNVLYITVDVSLYRIPLVP